MKDLYLTYTPYHLILSILKAKRSKKNSELIIVRSYHNADKYAERIREKNIFSDVRVVRGLEDTQKTSYPFRALIKGEEDTRFPMYKKVIERIKSAQGYPRRIFAFNDTQPLSQYILWKNKQNGGSNVYIEDGSGAYVDKETAKKQKMKKYILKLYFGRWYQTMQTHGKSPYTDKIQVFHPHLVPPRDKPVEELGNLFDEADEEVREIMGSPDISADSLIIAPLSGYLKRQRVYEEYIETVKDYVGDSPAVKYHPREEDYFLSEIAQEEITDSLPAESIFLGMKESSPTIIGDISTALYTAKLILPESKVISIANRLGIESDIIELLDRTGVEIS